MADADATARPAEHPAAVHWLADYVYGTIATLVAIAGLTFETHPGELTTAGVVIVGAVAIWFAHTLSRLVSKRSTGHLELRPADVGAELRHSWSIVTAAVPATVIFVLAAVHLWTIHTAFVLADVVGVARSGRGGHRDGGRTRPTPGRRIALRVAWCSWAWPSCCSRPASTCSDAAAASQGLGRPVGRG